ncbi:NrtR DNA-binding winged helix domain-containing protein [Nocardiopsis baichengensis]|uniref:NrtR DNA-binding winged helix domain-containing protein n=1 Tax=Nocardiopsis baichengensis TaxID=280240 RepID=UPI0003464FA0|nr:hypothetical protein [Nocardiopsis baichengensis]
MTEVDVVVAALAVDGGRPVVLVGGGRRLPRVPLGPKTPGAAAAGLAERVLPGAPPRRVRQLGAYGTGRALDLVHVVLVPGGAPTADGHAWSAPDRVAGEDRAAAAAARDWLAEAIGSETLALDLLPDAFTAADLRRVYEAVWSTTLDVANFRRWVRAQEGVIAATGEKRTGVGRPAALYTRAPDAPRRLRLPLARPEPGPAPSGHRA